MADYRVGQKERAHTEDDAGQKSDAETPASSSKPRRAAAADGDMSATTTGKADAGKAADESEAKPGSKLPNGPKDADQQPADAAAASSTDAGVILPPADSQARQQAGWAALTDWSALPKFSAATTQLFSTHERGEGMSYPLVDPGNKDFNSFLAVCGDQPDTTGQQIDGTVACGPGQSGYLVAADDGPGYVSRLLLARGVSSPSGSVLVDLRPVNERVRIYLDGAPQPALDCLWSELADGTLTPFTAPLTGYTSGGTISYLPISYSKELRVFVDDLAGASSLTLYYVHVTTQRVQSTRPYSADVLASPAARAELDQAIAAPQTAGASWFDADVALSGPGATTVWTREGAGTLQRIELQLDAASANETLNETSLRLSWDGGAAAVDLPLGAMFGSRHGVTPVSTLPLAVKSDGSSVSMSLSLPMPFATSAKLELVHTADGARNLKLRLFGTDGVPSGEWGRLRGIFFEQRDPQRGDRFHVAALSGRGKYIGTIFYAHGKDDSSAGTGANSELGFMDGDERLDVDGQTRWLGTGTDNFFNGGFYFKAGLFNSPFAALSQLEDNESAGSSAATMMRWTMLTDEINFEKQFDLSFEFGANRPGTVRDYAAVSFYYQ